MAPLQVIQHLLSCPELPNGEFDCDKCNTCHSFPTNEKDWAHWVGWRSQQSPDEAHIQRKRSLGSKMRDFALRKKDPSRKPNAALDPQFKNSSMSDTRPSTAASETPSTTFTNRGFGNHLVFPGQPGHGRAAAFSALEKSVLAASLPEVNDGMFWPRFDADVSDLPSTVSSIAISISSTVGDNQSETLSQNTSQSTLFSAGISPYQPPPTSSHDSSNTLAAQQYLFSTQPPFNTGLTSLSGRPPSVSAMSLDEPLRLTRPPLPPSGHHGWWNTKGDVETPRPSPPPAGPDPCFAVQAPMAGMLTGDVSSRISSPISPRGTVPSYYQVQATSPHPMSRALSQESMRAGIVTVYGTPLSEGNRLEALSPHDDHDNHHASSGPRKATLEPATEELVCDECQWKPRGVRENLKGYLRKHKNTHKGFRLACDVAGCTKTFSRLDNLKKHKKDKHGIDEAGSSVPSKRVASEGPERAEAEGEQKRPGTVESEIRGMPEDYSMLWPALHF